MPKSEDEIRAQIEADREKLIYYLGRMHGGMDTLEEPPASPEPSPANRPNYRRPPQPSLKNQRGGIQKAVLEFMRRTSRPVTMAEIHAGAMRFIGDIGREQIRQAVYRLVDRVVLIKHGNTFSISPSAQDRDLLLDEEEMPV